MDEQATVAPSPLALAGTDLEVQLGDAHVIERVMLIFRTLIDMRGGVSRQNEKFLPYVDIKTPIVPAKLRNQAGIVGAAYYASTKQQ